MPVVLWASTGLLTGQHQGRGVFPSNPTSVERTGRCQGWAGRRRTAPSPCRSSDSRALGLLLCLLEVQAAAHKACVFNRWNPCALFGSIPFCSDAWKDQRECGIQSVPNQRNHPFTFTSQLAVSGHLSEIRSLGCWATGTSALSGGEDWVQPCRATSEQAALCGATCARPQMLFRSIRIQKGKWERLDKTEIFHGSSIWKHCPKPDQAVYALKMPRRSAHESQAAFVSRTRWRQYSSFATF